MPQTSGIHQIPLLMMEARSPNHQNHPLQTTKVKKNAHMGEISSTHRLNRPQINWPSFERRKKILINTPIQGGQADLQIKALNKFMPKLPAGVQVVNLVHDEADLIVTPETLRPTVVVIRSAFQQAFAELYGDMLIPQIKFSVGQNWGELQELKLSK
jgi:DNA polymerase I-like protein with 3'-5' exonuclease and polymerase domains